MTFAANDIVRSDNKPSDVMATVVVTTAHPDNRESSRFPRNSCVLGLGRLAIV